ncbi:insulin-like receptor [Athalia rosae]|uniref:insulin-like receptor n=1 Tax=Athalia rosae TaxID=37344 RepID=UPI0020349476|nr:insulin-like receptor [Athalia rosae]XP_048513219.1 insulin-like receptor [Athalia rosae]XP_048513220.1 insulin-like receptor [Athalia rosae]XP_048513221.1 insulin-like receptor [Athalia rosae]XP_048513222.1 insulin-like receptor [Athalia rosae]XP_048513223.1 insulin-like receptor [Athalia rosae]XP_048513224.1 insulin-like receptor [Athalia rosae]
MMKNSRRLQRRNSKNCSTSSSTDDDRVNGVGSVMTRNFNAIKKSNGINDNDEDCKNDVNAKVVTSSSPSASEDDVENFCDKGAKVFQCRNCSPGSALGEELDNEEYGRTIDGSSTLTGRLGHRQRPQQQCELCERLQGCESKDKSSDVDGNERRGAGGGAGAGAGGGECCYTDGRRNRNNGHQTKRGSKEYGDVNDGCTGHPMDPVSPPSPMDCGRRRCDVPLQCRLRCASSVVRWRSVPTSHNDRHGVHVDNYAGDKNSNEETNNNKHLQYYSKSSPPTTPQRSTSSSSSSSSSSTSSSSSSCSSSSSSSSSSRRLPDNKQTSCLSKYFLNKSASIYSSVRLLKFSWTFAALIILLTANVNVANAQVNRVNTEISTAVTKRDVCQSVDVRNSVHQFSRLEGCRVVEGFVQILLIDHADDSHYANLTFPDLVEITGYLLLYRVNGLRSVGHLFPNLTVIRGHSLFINYALVAFEMVHLQEIGLHSLTNIVRGTVRFEKNPALCYVDTIDWDLITGVGKGEHVISGNKPKNGCPVCEKNCPTRVTKQDETLCWNRQHCQKVCNTNCGDAACSNTVPVKCCHPTCLGGCTGPTSQDCRVCREVVVAGNRCAEKCPPNTYEFLNRRCVQENECRKMKKPREAFDIVKEFPYKPFNNTCVTECPAGYMDEEIDGKSSCKKCDGLCLKECSGANVDSIASAQKLRGCTRIMGSLEIQIRGGKNIVKELEDSLSMIEEIDGYLKIVRSFPLISLNFLKNLRTIHGKTLESGKYSLVVLDNQNLQELWDLETHKSIKILARDGPAKVFFHFNPKLCLDTIEKFRKAADLPEFTELEVAPNSNGDKVACNVTKLRTRVTKKTSNAALIEWEAFRHHDPRSLLGYVVYFIEAPNNVTMFDGRDACGGDGWRVDDVSAVDNPEAPPVLTNGTLTESVSYLTHILTQLKPYTQYAFYVKTYTIATERSGAQSDLHYFTTFPDAPSIPRALSTWSNASNELVVTWEPPINKNGNLTHYRIVGRWEADDRTFLDQRNYCDEPLLLSEKKTISVLAEEARKKAQEEKMVAAAKPGLTSTCQCAEDETDPLLREKEVSSSIAFEDALHNQVYIKRPTNERRRRDLSETVRSAMVIRRDLHSYPEDKENLSEKVENGSYIVFNRTVYGQTIFSMKNLRHFAVYTIEVQACREPVPNDTLNSCCSTKSIKTARTLPIDSADDIPQNSFKYNVVVGNNSESTVNLWWKEPPDPNGLIVSYQIEYKNIDIQNVKSLIVCMTRQEFLQNGQMYVLRGLPAGNYSLKLRATSLAGNGAYTATKYFYIRELNAGGSHPFLWPVLSVLGLLILLLAGGYVLKRKFMPNVPNMRLIATVNPEYVSTVYVPDEWEVPRKKIELLRELGNGSFGMVYEGMARDVLKGKPEVKCAVKTVNENATDRERIEFLNEASVMKAFNTHHVVRLLGVVSQGQPTLVVMELMVNGDLKTYLRSHRPDVCENFSKQPPTLKRILQMAIEIADGMSYLAAKKFVHRDLAARNCMVAEDMTVKIGDFGMTRDIYETDYYRKGTKGLLPVRWMAPESLKDGVFTSFSDVWSYGVVLWEMVTLASQPYQGLSNDQVLRYVIDGGVMERPENCPDSLYTLMRRTWNHKPNQRPTFLDIATMLLSEVNVESFERVSFYHSPEGIEARHQNASHSPQADKDMEMATLHDLREDDVDGEGEGSEESPLRQDFGDFASFEPAGPNSIKISSNPIYGATTRNENSKVSPNFHEFNSSKVPLKADFEDFEGASMESLRSSRDTLDLPFAEESLKSVKNSPFVEKKNNSRGNLSDGSIGKTLSPGSIARKNFLETPRFSTIKTEDPDYENKIPEVVLSTSGDQIKDSNIRRIEFPSIDDVEDKNINEIGGNKSKVDYKSKPETLNNGYISGKTTQC